MPSWADLNKRQQIYMQAVFDVDQLQEANIKAMATRGRRNSTPASEWRWMPYNAAGAALLRRIQDAGYRDEGTGSTFSALERRGLVLCRYEPATLGGPILFVQITKAGRKLVREALNAKAPKALPVGTLREWHWRALCRAYVRGEQGLPYDTIWATDLGMSVGIPACDYGTTVFMGRSADLFVKVATMNRSVWSSPTLAGNITARTGSDTAICTPMLTSEPD